MTTVFACPRVTRASFAVRLVAGIVVASIAFLIGIWPVAAARSPQVAPGGAMIPVQLSMPGQKPAYSPTPWKRRSSPTKPAGFFTPEEQKRLAEVMNRLTPAERRRLAKAIEHLTPQQRQQLAESVKRQLAGQGAASQVITPGR